MWILLSLLASFGQSFSDVWAKRASATHSEETLTLARWLYAAPVMLALLPFVRLEAFTPRFFLLVLILAPLEITALILYIRSVARSPLSLSLPFLAFTPPLLLITGWIILGERPTAGGSAGVLLIGAGAWVLPGRHSQGFLAPIKALAREPGPRLMLGVAILYAAASPLGKMAVLESGALPFTAAYLPILTALLLLGYAATGRSIRKVLAAWMSLSPMGLALGAGGLAQYTAYALAPIAYVIAFKRTAILWGILAGGLLFKEADYQRRLFGGILMVAGVLVLGLMA
jgi:drug/metabolite transporter (DMT)-like permease